ncbi:hypothetical protein ELI_0564 [Eubacterium callanderi]|uniref:Uncharacterized protein n=1 Tax=Eubacterium callanderi TaxID=53442 RepID=E3GIU5_9FIRM|nr:hypothetical protein ELI_0564 [Eubacterium callanderi]
MFYHKKTSIFSDFEYKETRIRCFYKQSYSLEVFSVVHPYL